MVQEDHLAYEMIACKFPWLVKFHARNGLSRTLYSVLIKFPSLAGFQYLQGN